MNLKFDLHLIEPFPTGYCLALGRTCSIVLLLTRSEGGNSGNKNNVIIYPLKSIHMSLHSCENSRVLCLWESEKWTALLVQWDVKKDWIEPKGRCWETDLLDVTLCSLIAWWMTCMFLAFSCKCDFSLNWYIIFLFISLLTVTYSIPSFTLPCGP